MNFHTLLLEPRLVLLGTSLSPLSVLSMAGGIAFLILAGRRDTRCWWIQVPVNLVAVVPAWSGHLVPLLLLGLNLLLSLYGLVAWTIRGGLRPEWPRPVRPHRDLFAAANALLLGVWYGKMSSSLSMQVPLPVIVLTAVAAGALGLLANMIVTGWIWTLVLQMGFAAFSAWQGSWIATVFHLFCALLCAEGWLRWSEALKDAPEWSDSEIIHPSITPD